MTPQRTADSKLRLLIEHGGLDCSGPAKAVAMGLCLDLRNARAALAAVARAARRSRSRRAAQTAIRVIRTNADGIEASGTKRGTRCISLRGTADELERALAAASAEPGAPTPEAP